MVAKYYHLSPSLEKIQQIVSILHKNDDLHIAEVGVLKGVTH